MHAKFVDSV